MYPYVSLKYEELKSKYIMIQNKTRNKSIQLRRIISKDYIKSLINRQINKIIQYY